MTEETLFDQARALPEAERVAFLERECPDADLRARVLALLAADAASNSPLDQVPEYTAAHTPINEASTDYQAMTGVAGAIIAGRYKLLQQIGEGGMGTVWMAEQLEPVKRKVAVKLIRAEKGSSQTILARFEAERQAIALMDHPHIARLLDAGTTDTGAPFFVMELVKGIALNEYCDAHKLTIPERLHLFMQICGAVQHAHQKGIIHRDLKPSNILVESHDGKPVPKVIDFGLAKATTGLQLTEQSLFTGFGTVMGTPLYMAPEQATFNAIDVDTRADIYALGVVLYELLTGTTPITRDTFKKAALEEVLRLVREQEPMTPSSRLSSAESVPSVAANRQTEPARLGRFVKGELDWIVMRALAKERDRRYETANGFARDIERFLNHEPVQAGPPTAWYRLQKFVRRNRATVTATALVAGALVVGVIGTTLGLLEARRQAEIADQQRTAALAAAEQEREAKLREAERAEGEKAAKVEAEKNLKQANENLAFARKGNEILGSVFTGLDPKANYATVADLRNALKDNLQKAIKELEGSAIGDPLVVAEMQNTLGESLLGLGEAELAITVFTKAIATRQARLGADHPDTLTSMANLGAAYCAAKQGAKAAPLSKEFVAGMRKRFPKDDPRFAGLLTQVSLELLKCEQFPTAEEMLREAWAIREKKEPEAWTTFNTQSLLGEALLGLARNASKGADKESLARAAGYFKEAEPRLVKGYEGMKAREKTIPPQAAVRLPEALDRLIALYEALKKPDEVKKYRDLRATYPAAKK
jgi:tetratricopeptide (TPR) repeat protein